MVYTTKEKKIIKNNTELNKEVRNTTIYKKWAKTVKENAGLKCVCCGSNQKLEAHHTFSFKYYPCLRLDLKNGVCLCKKCHIDYHKNYNLENTSPATLITFIYTGKHNG